MDGPVFDLFHSTAVADDHTIVRAQRERIWIDYDGNKLCERESRRLNAGLVLFARHNSMTFGEAKSLPDAYVIMEGDYGGQCFLTAPMRLVKCQERDLRQLLHDLDSIYWDHVQGTELSFTRHKPGDFIDSGSDGGRIQEDLWIHKDLAESGLEGRVRRVLSGNGPLTDSSDELARLSEKFLFQLRAKYHPS